MRLFSLHLRRMAPAVAAAVWVAGVAAVNAQQRQPSGPPNALQGFSQNRDKLIKISATSLEVRDDDKITTFSGDVRLIQGDVRMYSGTLTVFYDGEAPVQPPPVTSNEGEARAVTAQITPEQIARREFTRIEAKDRVVVQQKDKTATGETAIFDMRADTAEMTGHVVITRGPNILTGDGLTVNMNTGDSRMTHKRGDPQFFIPKSLQRSAPSP